MHQMGGGVDLTNFKDYTKEKDLHITGLLADFMNQAPVAEDDLKEPDC